MTHAQLHLPLTSVSVARARLSDPSTSHEAAENINPHLSQELVINWMITAFRPVTSEEVIEGLNGVLSDSRIRGSLSELERQNRVRVLDRDGLTKRKRKCARYMLVG